MTTLGEPKFLISRLGMPDGVQNAVDGHVADVAGQWEWCWAVPLPYQVLAAPHSRRPMPESPDQGQEQDFMRFLGYWASLQSLLTFSLGWSRHDKGLRWWLDAGRPTEDRRLALIDQVWGRDGTIERYYEWAVEKGVQASPLHRWMARADDQRLDLDAATRRDLDRARASAAWSGASPHGMHLEFGSHIEGPTLESTSGTLTQISRVKDSLKPRAILTTDSAYGWYRALNELDVTSSSNGHDLRVDVFVRPMGYLGEYRRSRTTGLWFSGNHRFHSVGN